MGLLRRSWRRRRRLTCFAWAVLALLAARGLPASRGFATTPPQSQSPGLPEDLAARRRLGIEFVKAILNEPFETLPNLEPSDASLAGEEKEGAPEERKMRVWRNIPDPYTGKPRNIVLRSIVEPFWKSCIDEVEISNEYIRYRVCAVGTPGIGKTRTTPLLLRMLLLTRSSVVCIRRSTDRTSSFYEYVPTPDGEPLAVAVNVYPEETENLPKKIPSLNETSTYYVVDPGSPREYRKRRVLLFPPISQCCGGWMRLLAQLWLYRLPTITVLGTCFCSCGA